MVLRRGAGWNWRGRNELEPLRRPPVQAGCPGERCGHICRPGRREGWSDDYIATRGDLAELLRNATAWDERDAQDAGSRREDPLVALWALVEQRYRIGRSAEGHAFAVPRWPGAQRVIRGMTQLRREARRTRAGAEVPVVVAVAVVPVKATRLVKLICPFCGKRHIHGWPYHHGDVGSRLSHCLDGGKPYYVVVPDELGGGTT
jgi:hypothetical protein